MATFLRLSLPSSGPYVFTEETKLCTQLNTRTSVCVHKGGPSCTAVRSSSKRTWKTSSNKVRPRERLQTLVASELNYDYVQNVNWA